MKSKAALGLGLGLVGLLAMGGGRGGRGGGGPVDGYSYEVDPNRRYGDRWRNTRPPGLPSNARPASVAGAALPMVRSSAGRQGISPAFVAVLAELASGESGGRWGLPARNFDARLIEGYDPGEAERLALVPDPYGEARPAATRLITAWGLFQWNRDYGRTALGAARWFPWDDTPAEELERPVAHYARLWRSALARGLGARDCGRLVRLHHSEPATYERVTDRLTGGAPFAAAWQYVQGGLRDNIDAHLRAAGV